jgi:hypothetical protein
MGSLTIPNGTSKIVSVAGYVGGKVSYTIAEGVSGIIEIESSSFTGPHQFPLQVIGMLTSGLTSYAVKDWPADIPVKPGDVVDCYITLDDTFTPAFKGRVFLGLT